MPEKPNTGWVIIIAVVAVSLLLWKAASVYQTVTEAKTIINTTAIGTQAMTDFSKSMDKSAENLQKETKIEEEKENLRKERETLNREWEVLNQQRRAINLPALPTSSSSPP